MNFKTRFITFAIPFLWIAFSGCSKEYDCEAAYMYPVYVNYMPADLETYVIRKFEKGTSFQKIVDTFQLFNDPDMLRFNTRNDSAFINAPNENFVMRSDYDWQIFIPATNQTLSISQIGEINRKERRTQSIFNLDPQIECAGSIVTAQINGKHVQFESDVHSPYCYFLK